MQKQMEKVYKKTFPQSGKVVKIVPKLLLFLLCGQYDIDNNKDYGYHKKPAHNRQEHPGTVARIGMSAKEGVARQTAQQSAASIEAILLEIRLNICQKPPKR